VSSAGMACARLAILCGRHEFRSITTTREASAHDDVPIDRILTTYRQHAYIRGHLLWSQDLSRQGKRTSTFLHQSRSRTLGGPWRHLRGMGKWMEGHIHVLSRTIYAAVRFQEEGACQRHGFTPRRILRDSWMGHRSHMLSTRADINITGQALRPLGQQDLPFTERQVRVALPPAQEPP